MHTSSPNSRRTTGSTCWAIHPLHWKLPGIPFLRQRLLTASRMYRSAAGLIPEDFEDDIPLSELQSLPAAAAASSGRKPLSGSLRQQRWPGKDWSSAAWGWHYHSDWQQGGGSRHSWWRQRGSHSYMAYQDHCYQGQTSHNDTSVKRNPPYNGIWKHITYRYKLPFITTLKISPDGCRFTVYVERFDCIISLYSVINRR